MISENYKQQLMNRLQLKCGLLNLYLSMSFYLKREGFDGFAHWLLLQSQEELQHAYDLADYVIKRGGTASVDKIDVVPQGWGSALEVFEHVYKHECHVSELIENLVKIASEEKDMPSQDFLWGYVREQVEEEATAQSIVEKLKRCGDAAGILYMDDKLGSRK